MPYTKDYFTNKKIAELLRSIASAYLLKNENPFKIIAYENAASAVEHLDQELKDLWRENKLQGIPGVGSSIRSHMDEFFKTGYSKHFDEVLKGIPTTVFELMKIPTIGPKKAYKLVTALKLNNKKTLIKDLQKACRTNKIANLPNFGEKSQTDILKAIKTYQNRLIKQDRMPLSYAFSIATKIVDYLKKNPKVKRVDALGSLRRMVSTIGDIDMAVVVEEKDVTSAIKYFVDYPNKISVDNSGEKKASIIVYPYVRVDLRVQDVESYGSMLQYLTGSKTHNIKLREYALKKGYSLSEYGIKKLKSQNSKLKTLKFSNEKDFYNFLGLQYIDPEIREGTNEIELGEKKKLAKLVELKDIKGDLHIHSSYDLKPSHDSGNEDYLEIAKKAMSLGYEYVGFTDHNPSQSGNSEIEIIRIMKRRKFYIDQLFSTHKVDQFKYLIGLEVDILPNGTIALPEEAIDYVDYLIVSIHSSFNMSAMDMTQRVLKALQYPKVKILGHPTGRMLIRREGYDLEWSKIFDACQEKEIALEINAWPERLDLPDTLVHEAVKNQIKLVIDTDAHAVIQMDNMFYGVSVARRGWAKKSDIINARGYKEIKEWIGGE